MNGSTNKHSSGFLSIFDLRNGHLSLLVEYSGFLWIGMFLGLLSANLRPEWYAGVISEDVLLWINEYGMSFFFARAAKEVWEAMRDPEGALSSFRSAAMPLLATLGGWLGPFTLAFLGSQMLGMENPLQIGVVVTATDIVFSRLFLQMSIGNVRPVLTFITTLALVDDGLGLIAIATLFNEGTIDTRWLALTVVAVIAAVIMGQAKVKSHWWYFLLMNISWLGMHLGGLPPALSFALIIPFMPNTYTSPNGDRHDHPDRPFEYEEEERHDTLDRWAHAWHVWIEIFLLAFAFANVGINFETVQAGPLFFLLLVSVLVGKFVGVTGFTLMGLRLGLELPEGMHTGHLRRVGVAAAISLTVMLFMGRLAFHTVEQFSQVALAAVGSLVVSGGILLVTGLMRLVGRRE